MKLDHVILRTGQAAALAKDNDRPWLPLICEVEALGRVATYYLNQSAERCVTPRPGVVEPWITRLLEIAAWAMVGRYQATVDCAAGLAFALHSEIQGAGI